MNDLEKYKEYINKYDILVINSDGEVNSLEGLTVKFLDLKERYQFAKTASRIDPYLQIFISLAQQVSIYISLRIVESLISDVTTDLYIQYIKKPYLNFIKNKRKEGDKPYESGPNLPVNMLIQLTPEVLLDLRFLRSMDESDYEESFKDLPMFLIRIKKEFDSKSKSLNNISFTVKMLCYFDNKKREWFVESWVSNDVFYENLGIYGNQLN